MLMRGFMLMRRRAFAVSVWISDSCGGEVSRFVTSLELSLRSLFSSAVLLVYSFSAAVFENGRLSGSGATPLDYRKETVAGARS